MAQFEHLQVFQSMSRSPNARLHAMAELGNGMAVARWSNAHDARDYLAPSHHTLSCYLSGGTGTFRREQPGNKGAPDKLCILPADAAEPAGRALCPVGIPLRAHVPEQLRPAASSLCVDPAPGTCLSDAASGTTLAERGSAGLRFRQRQPLQQSFSPGARSNAQAIPRGLSVGRVQPANSAAAGYTRPTRRTPEAMATTARRQSRRHAC